MDTVFQLFVLYIADDCPGSVEALQACESFSEEVRIINVRDLPRPLPEWLVGTPTCVDVRDGAMVAHRGSDAILLLRNFSPQTEKRMDLPELPSDEQFDSMNSAKVTDNDLETFMKARDNQLPPPTQVKY